MHVTASAANFCKGPYFSFKTIPSSKAPAHIQWGLSPPLTFQIPTAYRYQPSTFQQHELSCWRSKDSDTPLPISPRSPESFSFIGGSETYHIMIINVNPITCFMSNPDFQVFRIRNPSIASIPRFLSILHPLIIHLRGKMLSTASNELKHEGGDPLNIYASVPIRHAHQSMDFWTLTPLTP